MSVLDLLKGSIKINIKAKSLVNKAIDDALSPAIKKVVADSSNTVDDMLAALILPILEKELKSAAAKGIDALVAKLPPAIAEIIVIE